MPTNSVNLVSRVAQSIIFKGRGEVRGVIALLKRDALLYYLHLPSLKMTPCLFPSNSAHNIV
jgi:hypothetical protein